MNANLWLEVARDRLYVVCLSAKAGGAAGMDEISDILAEIVEYRTSCKAHTVRALLTHVQQTAGEEDQDVQALISTN